MQAGKWVIAGALVLGLAPHAARADYWRYETDSGSTAFTDDAKNIPAKYRASAVKIAEESLFTYSKLSVVDPVKPTPRRVTREEAAAYVAPAPAREPMQLQGIPVPVMVDPEKPIIVTKKHRINADGVYTQYGPATTTTVRQGNKTIVTIDEQ